MLCPSCNTELKIAERQGIEIDYCPSCRGVWLDRGELDQIIERSHQAYAPQRPAATEPEKRKRGYEDSPSLGGLIRGDRWRDDDDDYEDRRRYDDDDRRSEDRRRRKKRGFLEEIFDIFD